MLLWRRYNKYAKFHQTQTVPIAPRSMGAVRALHRELYAVYELGVFGEEWVEYKDRYAGENNPRLCAKIEAEAKETARCIWTSVKSGYGSFYRTCGPSSW